MKKYGVKINYLYNSGFAVETKNYLLIFDYYKDSVEKGDKKRENGAIGREDLVINKKIIVFSSHSHDDHFNPVILSWKYIREDIKYVLSSDIKIDKKHGNIKIVSPYEELEFDNVYVKAYGSTDLGVSFFVKADDIKIFHAGDFNWWYWWDDSEEEIKKAENWFKAEIKKIEGQEINIAFFPVDPRLEHNYFIGGQYFINKLNPEFLIPMHFGVDYNVTKKFSRMVKNHSVNIIEITYRGQEIEL